MIKKEMRKKIKEHLAGIPEKQIQTGCYVTKIGTKFVHIINTWGTTTIEKIKLENFYNAHVA